MVLALQSKYVIRNTMTVKIIKLLATGFGLGLAPFAPGTFGTLGAIPLYYAMSHLHIFTYMGLTFLFCIIAVVVAELAESIFAAHDSKSVVIDEIVGFLVAMVWIPFTWKTLLAGFILFRFFDAVKPWPISHLDKNVKGGLGVVCDDIAAGIVTNLILQALLTNTMIFGFQLS